MDRTTRNIPLAFVAVVTLGGCADPRRSPGTDMLPQGTTGNGTTTGNGSVDGGTPSTTATSASENTSETTTGGDSAVFDIPVPDPEDMDPVIPETCAQAELGQSTVGCVFYAVDLDQFNQTEADQYAVAVSNVQLGGSVDVVIEQKVGGVWEVIAGPEQVDPLELAIFPLPDNHQQGSGVRAGGAYRVTADRPIIAYQFSPLAGGSYSSDASMLYPAASLDTLSYVPHWGGGPLGRGYITVAAIEDGTDIEVTPTTSTAAGPGVPGGGAGMPFGISLDEGDIAEVAVINADAGLAGTRIASNKPIAVFSGHECANVPADQAACDHVQEQISGVRLWGENFVASRVPVRSAGQPETSLWQILASEDGTTITLSADGDVTGLPDSPAQLDAGETLEFFVGGTVDQPGDFIIASDSPIAVMNYMSGAGSPSSGGPLTGDPAMVQLSPAEQFLPRYVVLVPNEWETDVFVVTRPAGADIDLDGVPMDDSAFIDVDDGEYEVARVVVADGVHTLEASVGFSVIVVGYDSYDSYAYLGGSGTGVINPNPAG